MKKILTLGFLLLGSEQLLAQTLPSYDHSYWTSPDCVKASIKSPTDSKTEEKVKKFCDLLEQGEVLTRQDLEKKWNTILSVVRLKCIAWQAAERNARGAEAGTESYQMLSMCIGKQMQK
jgi:hypothetical protein